MTLRSAWIREIQFRNGFVAVYYRRGGASLFGSGVPSWTPGLVAAGTGRRSVGLAYNRLLKGKFNHQALQGAAVRELHRLMREG